MERMQRAATGVLMVALLLGLSCGDKIQNAKTVLMFVAMGTEGAKKAINQVAEINRAKCLKQGAADTDAFKKCFAKTQEMLDVTDKLWPQLETTQQLAAAAIKAAEQKQSGQVVNYIDPIKKGVCLLTQVRVWLPESWKKKIDAFLALVGGYACDKPAAWLEDNEAMQLYVLKRMDTLLRQMLNRA